MQSHIRVGCLAHSAWFWSEESDPSFFVGTKLDALEQPAFLAIDRDASFLIKRWKQFATTHAHVTLKRKAFFIADRFQRNVTLNNLAPSGSSIIEYKSELCGSWLELASFISREQCVRVGKKRDMAYYQAWPVVGDIGSIKDSQLPSKQPNKEGTKSKSRIVDYVALNIDDSNLEGIVFVVCDVVGMFIIGLTNEWKGFSLGVICAIAGSLVVFFHGWPWDWPLFVIIPIAGIIVVVSSAWSWTILREATFPSGQKYRQD